MTTRYKRFGPRLTISLCGDDYYRLQALAEEGEVSISWVVRRAIEDYLHRHPQPSARMPRPAPRRERQAV
jgi:predicted transcriptional regulator